MKEIIIGTKNKAKVAQIKGALAPLKIAVSGLPDGVNLPNISEDGKTAQENARKKACAFAQALGQPVLSMDNALYFKNLSAEKQPGINVRRINARTDRPADEELLKYYSELVKELGGKADAYWEFAICLAYPNGNLYEKTITKPSQKIIEGYPLESIQIDQKSGKYISEMTQEEQDTFWQKAISAELCQFIGSIK